MDNKKHTLFQYNDYTTEESEFLAVCIKYKADNNIIFMTATEYFKVMLMMGYRKEDVHLHQ